MLKQCDYTGPENQIPSGKDNFFAYDTLRSFLFYMKSISKVTSLSGWKGERAIILRHDVDLDIKLAYNLSCIESEYSVESTFFIMTTCHSYNPNSIRNRAMLSEMADNGFEIGLHFDPSIYCSTELESKVDTEARILESIIGREIESISLHGPTAYGKYPLFKGYNNAYSPEIFSDDVYMSDSCMEFRGKNPFDFVKESKYRTIQVLLHPMHYSEDGGNYLDIMTKFILDTTERVDCDFSKNLTYAREGNSLDKIIEKLRQNNGKKN